MNAYYFAATITLIVTALLAVPVREWRDMCRATRNPAIPTMRRDAVLHRDHPRHKRHKVRN